MENKLTSTELQEIVKSKKNAIKTGGAVFSCIMLIPVLFHFLVFYCGVNLGTILLAFTTPTPDGEVLSLVNFKNFFAEMGRPDSQIFLALSNTLQHYLWGQIKFAVTCLVAYFFYKKIYGHKIYKVIFFLPSMVPGMVYISIFKNMITVYGPIDMMMKSVFGTGLPALMSTPKLAEGTIIFYAFWAGFGTQLLINVGAMNRIPEDVIDAAKLDGCIGFKEFWYIVFPLVFETIATYFLLGIASIFQANAPFLFFVGSDMGEIHTLSYWIFTQTRGGASNYPAAIGLITTVVTLPLVILTRWLINKVDTVTY